MATYYGSNATNRDVTVPAVPLDVKDYGGKVRRAYDSYTLAGELSVADIIKMMKIPGNSKIVDARVIAPSDGTTGQYDVGWEANGTEAADQDGLFAGASEVDTGAGAVDAKMLGTAAGYGISLSEETQIVLEVVEATTASVGDVIELEVFYVVE